jgi:hypothetical protein
MMLEAPLRVVFEAKRLQKPRGEEMNHLRKHSLAWLCLVIAPFILAGIELSHPAHFTADSGMTNFLSQPQAGDPHFMAIRYCRPGQWCLMHMIRTPLVRD